MSHVRSLRPAAAVLLTLGAAALAGCGSDDSSGSSSASSGARVDTAAARALLAPITGKPTAFPVTTPLKGGEKPGTSIAMVDCGTPICAIYDQLLPPAAKLSGVKFTIVKAGPSARQVNEALSSVIETKPDAVLLPGLDPRSYAAQLKQVKAAGIKSVAFAAIGARQVGVDVETFGTLAFTSVSKLQAAWIAVNDPNGTLSYYSAPELGFSALSKQVFASTIKQLCPGCSVRYVDVPAATIGSTAPQAIVSDLQAHPKTTSVVSPTSEIFNGLPSQLKTAGIKVKTLGSGAGPQGLQYIKDGQQTADISGDLAVIAWTAFDSALKLVNGQPVPAESDADRELLERTTDFDPKKAWTGYPDFPQRFAKLWGVGA